jgi:hypothetical protein
MQPPTIYRQGLPQKERAVAENIDHVLWQLNNFAGEFEECISLFEFTQKGIRVKQGWDRIAAKHGIITLFNFGKGIDLIRGEKLRGCPFLRNIVDHQKLRLSYKLFSSFFIGFEELRHSIAHAGEIFKGPDPFSMHAAPTDVLKYEGAPLIPWSTVMGGSILYGSQFFVPWKAKLLSYEVTSISAIKLRRVQSLCYEAFTEAELITRENAAKFASAAQPAGD